MTKVSSIKCRLDDRWAELLSYLATRCPGDSRLQTLIAQVEQSTSFLAYEYLGDAYSAVCKELETHKFRKIDWRDKLAKSAMTAMLASPELMECVTTVSIMEGSHCDKLSEHAYKQADSMIKVRDRV